MGITNLQANDFWRNLGRLDFGFQGLACEAYANFGYVSSLGFSVCQVVAFGAELAYVWELSLGLAFRASDTTRSCYMAEREKPLGGKYGKPWRRISSS